MTELEGRPLVLEGEVGYLLTRQEQARGGRALWDEISRRVAATMAEAYERDRAEDVMRSGRPDPRLAGTVFVRGARRSSRFGRRHSWP